MPRAGQATRRPGRAAAAGRRRVKKEQKRKIAQNNTDLPAPRRRSHGVPVQHDIQRQGTQLRHDGKQRKQKWIAFIKPAHEPASRKPAQAETALKQPEGCGASAARAQGNNDGLSRTLPHKKQNSCRRRKDTGRSHQHKRFKGDSIPTMTLCPSSLIRQAPPLPFGLFFPRSCTRGLPADTPPRTTAPHLPPRPPSDKPSPAPPGLPFCRHSRGTEGSTRRILSISRTPEPGFPK